MRRGATSLERNRRAAIQNIIDNDPVALSARSWPTERRRCCCNGCARHALIAGRHAGSGRVAPVVRAGVANGVIGRSYDLVNRGPLW